MSNIDGIVSQVVVLAGGYGTRLGNLTKTIPKPLMPIIAERSFLEILLTEYARQGFTDIVVVAGYLGETIQQKLHGKIIGDARISVVVEPEPRGTLGAVTFVKDALDARFLLVNGDTFITHNFRDFASNAIAEHEALMLLRYVDDSSRYGSATLLNGRVQSLAEKKPDLANPGGLVNAGVYLMHRKVIDELQCLKGSIEADLLTVLSQNGRLKGVECKGYFVDIGIPDALEEARLELPKKINRATVFLDRDGVINRDIGYLSDRSKLEWAEGATRFIKRMNDANVCVVVVTNQAGVARGLYTEDDVRTLHEFIKMTLARQGAFIDRFYYCPYHSEGIIDAYKFDHPERKPRPGMLLRAAAELKLDLKRSVLIGDKQTDIEAAQRAGISSVLVVGEHTQEAFDVAASIVKEIMSNEGNNTLGAQC